MRKAPSRRPSVGPPPAIGRTALLAAALAGLGASCAAAGSDRHLAPVWSRFATARGTTQNEVLGGFYVQEAPGPNERATLLAARPLWSLQREPDGNWLAHYFAPLGIARRRDRDVNATLFPLFIFRGGPKADGSFEWRFVGLPGVLLKENSRTGREFGWFPLYGRFDDFLGYGKVVFVLWPAYVRAEREGRISHHVPWPFLGWTRGNGERSFHLFPFFGRARLEGRYDRGFVLWPFHARQRNDLAEDEIPERIWWLWPLYGRVERGTFRGHTVLWPFFGYASDPESGFWALDAPWPLIRLQRGGDRVPPVERTRFWPLFGHVRADRLDAWSFLWPLIHVRHENGPALDRRSLHVLPFWRSWHAVDLASGERSSWRKLWPLFQRETRGERVHGSFPALDPLWRNRLIEFHYGWMWRLWEWEEEGPVARERSWLGLWRREKDAFEDRRSLSMLWSSRSFREDGARVRETSLLFGLLRWRRKEGGGFEMLRPAFPGPGWPAVRKGAGASGLPEGGPQE